jgi:hypothetical protein
MGVPTPQGRRAQVTFLMTEQGLTASRGERKEGET